MPSSITSATLMYLLAGAAAAFQAPQAVFVDKQQASSLISRQKRNAASTLEQTCMERVCTYDEARKFFPDSYRTDIFWSVYVDGDQCAPNPCKNGAMCSDSVGGYDCVCKSGFAGVHCENDTTLCPMEKDQGCAQFCKPGYTSYQCSCAYGWKVSPSNRNKCEAQARFPCGKLNSLTQWQERQSSNERSNFAGLSCTSAECPWQALLVSSESAGYCSGVILKENMILTSAQCARKYSSFRVAVGKRRTGQETGQQVMSVKQVRVHPRYAEGRPDNDLAVVELHHQISFKREVFAACLPEKDFAENILMMGDLPAVVTGWKEPKEASAFEGPLTVNQLTYRQLSGCLQNHPNLITNKMGCTENQTNADCIMSSGSPLLTLYREVFFLTGVVTQPPGADCNKGYIFQKVSRYLSWLKPLVG
ncbi:protein Z, vitamin K-dependent plasma glycoprotein a isoform 1-T2 [Pholidichthys leucotaenia]